MCIADRVQSSESFMVEGQAPPASRSSIFMVWKQAIASTLVHSLMFPPPCLLTIFHRSFSEVKTLVDKYGPVFSLRSGSQVVVVVGTLQTAKEILDHDSALTADRPLSVAALEVMSGGMRLLLLSSGDRFRRFKRYTTVLFVSLY